MAGLALSFRATLSQAVACLLLWLLSAGAVASTNEAPDSATANGDQPLQIFARFKSALDANDLVTAGERAQRLVAVVEAKYGSNSRELVNPLTNLGTVYFRRGEFAEAEAAYRRAVGLIEGELSGADRMLIRPLEGLGETWLALGRPAEAVAVLRRAVDLSRNLDGLFNIDQLDTVDALIEAYVATGQQAEAEREHQSAFRIAETAYGKRDLRLVEPLDRYARWFESVGRYTTARGLHARALQLAEELSSDKPIAGVPGLRGLARTWLLEAIYGPEVEAQPAFELNENIDPFIVGNNQSRLNSEGVRALTYAVDIIRRTEPLDSRMLGETLAQLGDWHLVSGNLSRANTAYADGWKALSAAGSSAATLFDAPRVLVYRAPSASVTRMRPANPTDYAIREVDMRLRIASDGKVSAVDVASSTAPENTTRAAALAARKARFAPRLVAGDPVATEGVVLRERLFVRIQPEKASTERAPTEPASIRD